MRGSGGRGRALRAEERQTGQQHSEPSAQAFTPQTSLGEPPLHSKRCFLQKPGPQDRRRPPKVGLGLVTRWGAKS